MNCSPSTENWFSLLKTQSDMIKEKELSGMIYIICLQVGVMVIAYGFILRFQTQDKLNLVCKLLKEKSSLFKLRTFFNPANVPYRFILVIECAEKDVIEFLENYFLRFYSGDVAISLLHEHESEIDKMKPI